MDPYHMYRQPFIKPKKPKRPMTDLELILFLCIVGTAVLTLILAAGYETYWSEVCGIALVFFGICFLVSVFIGANTK